MEEGYSEELSSAEFWSLYDIVYVNKMSKEKISDKYIPLLNNCGYIRRRSERAVLKYYLNYENEEHFARGLLILFYPFRNEMRDIHENDVQSLYEKNKSSIQRVRNIFEKHRVMSDIIFTLQKERNDNTENNELADSADEFIEEETTSAEDIEKFQKWAKDQAKKMLTQTKDLTTLVEMKDLRTLINQLSEQQRIIFDDFVNAY